MNTYRLLSMSERLRLEALLEENIVAGFGELVDSTTQWLSTPAAAEFFYERQGQLNAFYRESGIQDQWQDIITQRATRGADIAEQVYNYARSINAPEGLVEYNTRERAILNSICDNQYELVKNASEYEVQGIRRSILQDVAEGVNPRQTSLREVQLTPLNGLSPEQRAVTIARTETATITNTATLEQYRSDGIEYVELSTGPGCCEECEEMAGQLVEIEVAMEDPTLHPNCRCAWKAVLPTLTAEHPTESEGWLNQ